MHLLCLNLLLMTSWSFSHSTTAPALNLKWVKGHFEHFAPGTDEHSFPHKEASCPKPADCEDLRISGYNTSGVYAIWPRSRLLTSNSVRVYCDMTTNGGGWTVIQRRGNYGSPEDYFFEDWDYYKRGFGSLERDFWLGNDNIYALTNQGAYEIRFELTHTNGTSAHAQYKSFWIDNEEQMYKLNIKGYSGNAGIAIPVTQSLISLWGARPQYLTRIILLSTSCFCLPQHLLNVPCISRDDVGMCGTL